VFLVLLVIAGTCATPQNHRQSSLSSPLAMGMRILGNIRNGMTRTFQGIFGGNQQGKETNQIRAPNTKPKLPPPEPAPIAQVHDIGFGPSVSNVDSPLTNTDPPTSFFKVVHELDSTTSFPDTRGFTDESFKPSDFFTGKNPFQGTVEEETLPFHQEVAVPKQNPAIQENKLPSFSGSDFPSQAPKSHTNDNRQFSELVSPVPSPPRTTFHLEDAKRENVVPTANTNPIANGNIFNQGTRVAPTHRVRQQSQGPELLDFPKPHSILSSRVDSSQTRAPFVLQPQALVTSLIPKHNNFRLTTRASNPTPNVQKAILVGKLESTPPAATVSVFVGHQRPVQSPPVTFSDAGRFTSIPKPPSFPTFKEVKQQKELPSKPIINDKHTGHINTGIKMRLSPSSKDREGEVRLPN
ncbi:hypothetical protein SK128_014958, partial [Halocaridina rubra]